MIRYLTLGEVVALHKAIVETTGGATLALNHPSVDGNKRVAHAAMEVFLILNGLELTASVDEQEQLMLDVARGSMPRDQLTAWLEQHVKPERR